MDLRSDSFPHEDGPERSESFTSFCPIALNLFVSLMFHIKRAWLEISITVYHLQLAEARSCPILL